MMTPELEKMEKMRGRKIVERIGMMRCKDRKEAKLENMERMRGRKKVKRIGMMRCKNLERRTEKTPPELLGAGKQEMKETSSCRQTNISKPPTASNDSTEQQEDNRQVAKRTNSLIPGMEDDSSRQDDE